MKIYDFQPGDIVTAVIPDGESGRGVYGMVLGWKDPLHLIIDELTDYPEWFFFEDWVCTPEDWLDEIVYVKHCNLVSRSDERKNDIIEANRSYERI